MQSTDTQESLLRELLALHGRAFELRAHDVSFHLLSAAAHAADSAGDTAALESIEGLARRDLAWIDANQPDYRHSTASAKTREHRSIFEQLAVMTAGMRARIEANHKLRRADAQQRGLGWADAAEPA
jgi:hypothetical protein